MSKTIESMISNALIRNGYTARGEKLPVCPECGSTEWNRAADYSETQYMSQSTGAWETDYSECHDDSVSCGKCNTAVYDFDECDEILGRISDLNTLPSDELVNEWIDWFCDLPEGKGDEYLRLIFSMIPEYLTDPAGRDKYLEGDK